METAAPFEVFSSNAEVRILAVTLSLAADLLYMPFLCLRCRSISKLAALNLIGSIVYALFYIAKVITWSLPFNIQANVCAFCGSCYFYYISEMNLFLNRLEAVNPKMTRLEKRDSKYVKIAGNAFTISVVAVGVADVFHRDFGVIIWNGYEHALFCSAPANLATYIIFPITASSGVYVWLMGMRKVHQFMASSTAPSNQKRSQFLVLKLMLASFTTTMLNASLIVLNHMVSHPPLNFALDFTLFCTVPIDVLLSLVLSSVVYIKLRAAMMDIQRAHSIRLKVHPIESSRFAAATTIIPSAATSTTENQGSRHQLITTPSIGIY